MQDVINKPLGSKAVREVIGHLFADLAGDEADEQDDVHHQDALLDLPFLTDYASTVGKPVLLSSVELFEKMMPDYMAVLDSNMIAGIRPVWWRRPTRSRGGGLHRPAPVAADGPAYPEPGSPRLVGRTWKTGLKPCAGNTRVTSPACGAGCSRRHDASGKEPRHV